MALVVLGACLALVPSLARAQEPEPTDPPPEQAPTGPVELALVAQTPVVTPPGRVDLRLAIGGAPPDAFVELVLRAQVGTRSEYVRAVEGQGLRSRVASGTRPRLDTLPVDPADGSRTVSLSLDPSAPGGVPLTNPGAYPLEVRVVGPGGEALAELVTFVVVAPPADTPAPPLAVAVVATLGAPPATPPSIGPGAPDPDGTDDNGPDDNAPDSTEGSNGGAPAAAGLGQADVDRLAGLAGALAAAEVPATLAIVPETVDVLAAGGDPDGETLDLLAQAAAGRTVLARPYADVSVEALAGAGLLDELGLHLVRGGMVLLDELGVEVTPGVTLADPDLGPTGARALADGGFERLVLDGAGLDPAPTGGLSLAHRFLVPVDGPGRPVVDAVEADEALAAHLEAAGDPALQVQRLVAELAVIRGEQPAVARGVVIRVGDDARPEVVAGTLRALGRAGTLLEPVDLPELFEHATLLTDPAGTPVRRDLAPEDAPALGQDVVAGLPRARQLLAGYEHLLGPGSARSEPLHASLLLATARHLSLTDRRDHLATVQASIDELTAAISLPDRRVVTLTDRAGTIPLTIDNAAGFPVEVLVRLDSTRLEFPGGPERALTLEPGATRADLGVRTRSSGAFPLDVTLVSPDGTIELATTRYTIQSTAVSGVGLILSVGAGLFLVVWWGSHWRRTRRSRRLAPVDPGGG